MAAERKRSTAQFITVEQILAAAKERPDTFIKTYYDKPRQAKECIYYPVTIILADGKEVPLTGIRWSKMTTCGKIKPAAEREKMGAAFMFRGSSDLGKAVGLIYNNLDANHEAWVKDPKTSREDSRKFPFLKYSSVYQTIVAKTKAKLDDPIVRVGLKFNKDTGAPTFELSRAQIGPDGKPQIKKISGITNANVHNYGLANTTTTGTASIDSVCFSNMGASAPFNLSTAIIKSGKREVADIADDVTAEELADLVGDEEEGEGESKDDGDDVDPKPKPSKAANTKATAIQAGLAALRAAAEKNEANAEAKADDGEDADGEDDCGEPDE